VTLDAQTEEGPFQVKVTQPLANGTLDTLTRDDVLFGDVWLCSGQSNMHFSVTKMFNASIEFENAYKYPKIRLFTPQYYVNYIPQEEIRYIAMNCQSHLTLA
jgi:sialate O-acetylesterase